MRALPAGTVTFLFTDVEGSTRLLLELGDAYAEALAEHRRILRDAFDRHKGVEVDTQGDAFFVAFARAQDALGAAADGLTALGAGPIRVRIGVHTGEPIVTDEGYVGIDVHRAARIAAVGHGGQVLVSQSTRDLVPSADLRDLGEHRLKDLTAPERIYQLGHDDFPPLKSLNATNLPVAAALLVGRAHELRELTQLLRDARVVTLTGPGGVGKTRLALQVAAELVEDHPGGVFFVPLASVPDATLVTGAIVTTIGVHELADLRDRRSLLVLDNVEHLLDSAPDIAQLVASSPELKLLVTSRAPLRIAGEHTYPLEPLPESDALALFTERAREIDPAFVPDEPSRAICARLDGLPLALELAAARLRTLDTTALLERLDRSLPILTTGRRDAPERQRTLRATIEWSYDLLDEPLRQVFARLGVFATFSLDAAAHVAGAELDAVDALVEASLVKRVDASRYLMLTTIRELALERLDDDEEPWRRLIDWLTEQATRASLTAETTGPMRHELVIPERGNIRAALEWALAHDLAGAGLRLALQLENYWVTSSDPREGTRWIESLLAQYEPTPVENAIALRALGNCAMFRGERAVGALLYERSLSAFRELGNEVSIAAGMIRLAANVEKAERRALIDEALVLSRRHGYKKGEAQALLFEAELVRTGGDPERAVELLEESLALTREAGFTFWLPPGLAELATTLQELGRDEEARRRIGEALQVTATLESTTGIIELLAQIARLAVGDDPELAGRLWGAIEAEMERAPLAFWVNERDELAGQLLDEPSQAFEEGRAAGHQATLDDAITRALAWADR